MLRRGVATFASYLLMILPRPTLSLAPTQGRDDDSAEHFPSST